METKCKYGFMDELQKKKKFAAETNPQTVGFEA